MNGVIKIGNISLFRQKTLYSTTTETGTQYPIKIYFNRQLTDDELWRLGVYAFYVEKGADIRELAGKADGEEETGETV